MATDIKFASKEEITAVQTIEDYIGNESQSGIVLGENIFTNNALLFTAPTSNVFVMALLKFSIDKYPPSLL